MRAPHALRLRLLTGVSWPWQLTCFRRAVKNKSPLFFLTNSAMLVIILDTLFLSDFRLSLRASFPGTTSETVLLVFKENPKEYLLFQCYAQDAILKSWSLLELLTREEVTASESIRSMDMTWEFCDKTQPGN